MPERELPAAGELWDILGSSAIYRKLDALGLCDDVRCLFLRHQDGSPGSVIVADRTEFFEKLLASGRFCRDSERGAMLHGSRTSVREIPEESGDALHFSFGERDHIGCTSTASRPQSAQARTAGAVTTEAAPPPISGATSSRSCSTQGTEPPVGTGGDAPIRVPFAARWRQGPDLAPSAPAQK